MLIRHPLLIDPLLFQYGDVVILDRKRIENAS